MSERNPGNRPDGGPDSPLVYIGSQLVNVDRIAEIALTPERVTVGFAGVPVSDPRARMVLSWQDAQLLLSALDKRQGRDGAWVALPGRLVNIDLAVDVWATQEQVTLISAQPSGRGGPLPRRWPRNEAAPLLAYFRSLAAQGQGLGAGSELGRWIAVGEHLINLDFVTQVRFGSQHVQILFAGLPRFSRSFAYGEATPLLDRLQRAGVLPIEGVRYDPDPGAEAEETSGDEAISLATSRPRRPRRRRWW